MNKKLILILSLAVTSGLSASEGEGRSIVGILLYPVLRLLDYLGSEEFSTPEDFARLHAREQRENEKRQAKEQAQKERFKRKFKPGKYEELCKQGFGLDRHGETGEWRLRKLYNPVAPGEIDPNGKVNDTDETKFFIASDRVIYDPVSDQLVYYGFTK